jgi:Fe2+ or Zn2+ uptake regulation protein
MSFADVVTADIRLVILKALAENQGYSANESILQEILGLFGHTVTRDRMRTELGWLEEQGLVTVCDAAGIKVARITGRGIEVSTGAARVDGIKRPRPRA